LKNNNLQLKIVASQATPDIAKTLKLQLHPSDSADGPATIGKKKKNPVASQEQECNQVIADYGNTAVTGPLLDNLPEFPG
jgi:hypothetical protein